MKKIFRVFTLTAAFCGLLLAGCEKNDDSGRNQGGGQEEQKTDPEPEDEFESVGTFSLADISSAAAAFIEGWENDQTLPGTVSVGGKSLTLPQWQYALCAAVGQLASDNTDDVKVLSFKPGTTDPSDNYDKGTIAFKNGPAAGENTEDLANVASRMIAQMKKSLRVPDSVLYVRDGATVGFGCVRATVVMARALAEYASANKIPSEVETRITKHVVPAGPVTIRDFATQFVKVLDIWENNVGTIHADASHTFDNVHYIPTVSDYEDSDNNKADQTMITVGKNSYTLYQAWELAIRGIIDMITVEGSSKLQSEIGTPVHTPGDGVGLDAELPAPSEWAAWTYPWYEKDADLNLSAENPVTMPLLLRLLPWWYKRANDFGYVGNFQYLHSFGVEGFTGMICSMRCLLIMARFYKAVLDGGISSGVYTYMKDKTIDPDLYAQAPAPAPEPDPELDPSKQHINIDLNFVADNKTGAVLYKNAEYFPSNTQAGCDHEIYPDRKYNNFLRTIEYDFGTDYTFKMWSRYGVMRSTGSGVIRGLRLNVSGTADLTKYNGDETLKVPYGGKDGSAWIQFPAIPGYKLFSVSFTLYSDSKYLSEMGEWHVVSDVAASADGKSYAPASGCTDFGKMTFSDAARTSKVTLRNPVAGVAYYCISEQTYNGEISEMHLVYEQQ